MVSGVTSLVRPRLAVLGRIRRRTPVVAGAPAGRHLVYAPQPDGQADPGEIVWTWVAYEDDPAQGKDRPVLVVGRSGTVLFGLMLSSQRERHGQRHWFCLLYTSPSPRDRQKSRMPSSA